MKYEEVLEYLRANQDDLVEKRLQVEFFDPDRNAWRDVPAHSKFSLGFTLLMDFKVSRVESTSELSEHLSGDEGDKNPKEP